VGIIAGVMTGKKVRRMVSGECLECLEGKYRAGGNYGKNSGTNG
jgi:hypothetical protein